MAQILLALIQYFAPFLIAIASPEYCMPSVVAQSHSTLVYTLNSTRAVAQSHGELAPPNIHPVLRLINIDSGILSASI